MWKLLSAAGWGDLAGVQNLSQDAPVYDREDAMRRAAQGGHLEVVRYLIEQRNVDVNAQTSYGMTALMWAASSGNVELVRYLVKECHADVNASDNRGMSAIRISAAYGYHETQRILTPPPHLLPARRSSTNVAITDTVSASIKEKARLLIPPSELELIRFAHNGQIGGDFRAKWLDSDVVVKLFVADAANSPFEEEVHLWQQLRHPNVVKMYGACDVGPLLKLFVCEHASKGSLGDLVTLFSADRPAMWKYLYNAALGLEYLHERGIVHGELRCSNILIGGDGGKLSNFGMSGLKKRPNQDAVGNFVVGSKRWQAFEVFEGKPLSHESDVYSLGMCIVEAETGGAPWSNQNERMCESYKWHWVPKKNDDRCGPGHIPGDARELVWRMCCRDPHERISLSSVVYELERLATQESPNSCQPEHDPAINFNDYKNGKLKQAWVMLETYMKTRDDGRYRRAFADIKRVCDHLQDTIHDPTLLPRFHTLLNEFYQMVKMSPEQTRMLRLSSTRATSTSLYAVAH